jgi:hypothetical protein
MGWRDIKVGDKVAYTGQYHILSHDLIGMMGIVQNVESRYPFLSSDHESISIDVFFASIAETRSVFASNCTIVSSIPSCPSWEV